MSKDGNANAVVAYFANIFSCTGYQLPLGGESIVHYMALGDYSSPICLHVGRTGKKCKPHAGMQTYAAGSAC